MTARLGALATLGVLLIVGLGVAGYFLGESRAPTATDAGDARESAYREAVETAQDGAAEASIGRGKTEGLTQGRERGQREGKSEGRGAGETAAAEELAAVEEQQAAEAAEAEAAAAEAEAAERAANCGAPLFADDYCPTDEQIEQENTAESLCGPGTAAGRAEAAEMGIQC